MGAMIIAVKPHVSTSGLRLWNTAPGL
jgi:hypothetical protein